MAQTFSSLAPLLGFPSTDARGTIFFLGIDHFGGRSERSMQEQNAGRQEWPHSNTAMMIEYLRKMQWKTPFLGRLCSINTQCKMVIDSMDINYFDFSSFCQGGVQPRNSHRLGLVQDRRLICHNRKAHGRQSGGAEWKSGQYMPDRGSGPSGAQMLNNLQLIQPSLSTQSPLRDSLVHLTLSGCQLINKSAIDIFLRLSHSHLPEL